MRFYAHRTSIAFLSLSLTSGALLAAQPVGTAFTFQGQLIEGGAAAADGTYQFVFRVFDVASGGTALDVYPDAGTLAVAVAGGIFTTEIDFGARYNGDARWLEIQFTPPGGVSQILDPRIKLTGIPYALGLGLPIAETVNTSSPAFDITNAGGTTAEFETSSFISDAVVVRSSGGVFSAALFSQQTGDGPAGHFSKPLSTGGAAIYGETFGDSYAGQFSVLNTSSSANAVHITTNGNSDSQALYATHTGNGDCAVFEINDPDGGNSGEAVEAVITNGSGNAVHALNKGTGRAGYFEIDDAIIPSNANPAIEAKTDGLGSAAIFSIDSSLNDSSAVFVSTDGDGGAIVTSAIGNGNAFQGSAFGEGNGVYGLAFGTGNAGRFHAVDSGTLQPALYSETNGDGPACELIGNADTSPSNDGLLVIRDGSTSVSFDDNEIMARDGTSVSKLSLNGEGGDVTLIQSGSGGVGIGTSAPDTRLHIVGGEDAELDRNGSIVIGSVGGDNLTVDDNEIMARSDGAVATLYLNNEGGRVIITPGDTTEVSILEIKGGSDLSEQFDVSGPTKPEPGMVVCIDPANPGKLILSQQVYDRTVAGVISGAGGVQPGMRMGQEGTLADGDYPVALTGRVYVWADASTGPIQPGDLLTTSAVPGHAMKVSDHAAAQGAIIGKAMTDLSEGCGLVLVLVSLQ